jgi:putative SOS response-associated peptidase YedK
VPTAANGLMAGIHNRMPVILTRRDEDLWLDWSMSDQVAALACLQSYPLELLETYLVLELVNSVRHDRRKLIEPVR